MNSVMTKVKETREFIKTELVTLIKTYYVKTNGQHPNFEIGEDYFVDTKQYGRIGIVDCIFNSETNDVTYEEILVDGYIATLDDGLYFDCDDLGCELHWDDVRTDDLLNLYNNFKYIVEKNSK